MGGKRGGGVRGRVGVSGGGDVEVGGVGWWLGVGVDGRGRGSMVYVVSLIIADMSCEMHFPVS